MYISSDSNLLEQDRANAAKAGVCSDGRIQAMRRISATGRAALFNTLVNPDSISAIVGTGAALDAATVQQQTETSRAVGLLGTTAGGGPGPSVAEIISGAPEVVSLNRGSSCGKPVEKYTSAVDNLNARPGIPRRAPKIINTSAGPLHFKGAESTVPGAYPEGNPGNGSPDQSSGLTGYAPPWSDAWVMQTVDMPGVSDTGVVDWVMDHPWLSLFVVVGGVVVISRRSKR
jgi:hypothetical protein